MGLFDQLLGGVVGQFGTSQQKNSLMDLATSVIQSQGGLSGIVQKFETAGLGAHASSWVGTGTNMPVSADQIQKVLGSGQLQAMAQKLGINPQTASAGLAALLPVVIDHLTPKGQVEQGGDLNAALATIKSKLMAQA
jgi:uncharacterized protein YidB (DUF937 family)